MHDQERSIRPCDDGRHTPDRNPVLDVALALRRPPFAIEKPEAEGLGESGPAVVGRAPANAQDHRTGARLDRGQ